MSELIDTTEMYLRTIYELIEEGVPPLRARIAERLKQSGPTVSQTVARMERDGLVSRKVYPTTPPRVEYALTDLGQSLRSPVEALGAWAIAHEPQIVAAQARYDAENG